jgi:hypothetical protein
VAQLALVTVKVDRHLLVGLLGLDAVGLEVDSVCEAVGKVGLDLRQRHVVVWALGASDGRNDRAQIELERLGEFRVLRLVVVVAERALRLEVRGNQRHLVLVAPGGTQILERRVVGGEEANRGTVLGRHVGDRGTIGDRQLGHTGAVEFDKLVHHTVCSKIFRDGKHQVRGGGVCRQLASQLVTNDLWQEHRDWLAANHSLGLDTTNTPTNAKTRTERNVMSCHVMVVVVVVVVVQVISC